jgi:hypothetical protein
VVVGLVGARRFRVHQGCTYHAQPTPLPAFCRTIGTPAPSSREGTLGRLVDQSDRPAADVLELHAVIEKKRFAIGFNREASGGIDTTLPLDIREPNPTHVRDFKDCMLTPFTALRRRHHLEKARAEMT